jgi:uncharacterized protein
LGDRSGGEEGLYWKNAEGCTMLNVRPRVPRLVLPALTALLTTLALVLVILPAPGAAAAATAGGKATQAAPTAKPQPRVTVEREVLSPWKVPCLVCWQKGKLKLPVAIAVHWSGGSKEGMQGIGEELARRGFIAVLPDVRTYGERTAEYASGGTFPSLLDDTAKEISSIITALGSDKRADTERVGITGISLGGLVTHAVVARDGRIGAAAPIAGSPDWHFAQGFGVPGSGQVSTSRLMDRWEPLSHPGRYYPCALLMLHGRYDGTVPLAGSQKLYNTLIPFYAKAPAKLKLVTFEKGHDIGGDPQVVGKAIDWLTQWLVK